MDIFMFKCLTLVGPRNDVETTEFLSRFTSSIFNTANILLYLFFLLIPPPPLPSHFSLTRTKDVILSYVTHSYNEWHIIFQKQNIYRNYPILHGKNKDIFIILSQDKGIALNRAYPSLNRSHEILSFCQVKKSHKIR